VFFGLLLAGCTKESTQTGLPGSQSSTGGQGYPSTSTGGSTSGGGGTSTGGQGYPSTSTGTQGYQGSTTFAKTIGGISGDAALSIIQSSDGGYAVAGYTESFGAGYSDFYVVKLDSSGNVVWTKTIGGSSRDEALSIIQSSD
jgi:hypothetical protein